MNNLTYVYILTSKVDPDRHYTDITQELEKRLKAHDSGAGPSYLKIPPLAD
jgi:predicted GIY-YIG superfamily endonuclease